MLRARIVISSAALLFGAAVSFNAGIVDIAQAAPNVPAASLVAGTPAPLSPDSPSGLHRAYLPTPDPSTPPRLLPGPVASMTPVSRATPIASATPAAAASSPIIASFVGRLLDLQSGFVFFASGDAFHIADDASRLDLRTKAPFNSDDVTGLYGKAEFSADGVIRALSVDKHAFPPVESGPSVAQFAVAKSVKTENPELADDGNGFTGAPVLVSFTVTVPPTTPLTGYIYLTTEASRWNPMEIRMDRVDALHYRITRSIASGTKLVYRYTRGTWRSSERGRDGLEGPPRRYTVQNLDVARRDDTVYHWSDETITGAPPISPDAVPTPFNGQPFSKQS